MTGQKFIPRADHVGSLLRPDSVKAARKEHFEEGNMSAVDLMKIEDEAIIDLVKMQESVGMPVVTDGEARRSFWHYDYMGGLTGLDLEEREEGVQFAGMKLRPIFPTINGPLDFPDDHPMLDHYRYLESVTSARPKISIPGPSCCHFRTALDDIRHTPYRDDVEHLMDDIIKTYQKAVKAFYDAGCRYLQLDDIFFAYLCDPKHRADKTAIGQDPDWLIEKYGYMMYESIKYRPDDMTIGMHMCRGNMMSTHAAEGSYHAVADTVFNKTGVDVFFMEYDTERAGDLDPLGELGKGSQRVMLGFITTKTGALEPMDQLKRQFDRASKFADMDQLGIAPQCGFASTEEGNSISVQEQADKLGLVLECAGTLW